MTAQTSEMQSESIEEARARGRGRLELAGGWVWLKHQSFPPLSVVLRSPSSCKAPPPFCSIVPCPPPLGSAHTTAYTHSYTHQLTHNPSFLHSTYPSIHYRRRSLTCSSPPPSSRAISLFARPASNFSLRSPAPFLSLSTDFTQRASTQPHLAKWCVQDPSFWSKRQVHVGKQSKHQRESGEEARRQRKEQGWASDYLATANASITWLSGVLA